jgi:hypothetical protein
VYDISGYRTSVFDLAGAYVREFRFGTGSQLRSQAPYASACNGAGTFVHYGWEDTRNLTVSPRVFRQRVPFWISGADSSVRAVLDSFPGSERVVSISSRTGLPSGTGPRIFGKQTSIAIGRTRLYIGTGDPEGIVAVRLSDLAVDTIAVHFSPSPVTQADIDAELAVRIAGDAPDRRAGTEREFSTHPFPDTLPRYAKLIVDSEDLLWVQEFPRASSSTVRWLILSGDAVIAHVSLPTYLEPSEIGRDYVLGRYLDPVESIPQVRMFTLERR